MDFLVIGGGIQGAALAREAALRGCRTLLVDRGDFGGGTSSRSSRLVHGGVRYLQQGNVSLVREALSERERLLRLAPHLVRPLPMIMPFFRDGGGSPLLTRMGLRLYSWLAGRSTLPGPRALGPNAALEAFPGLRSRGLRSAVKFFDAATQDLRLTLAVVRAAVEAGALVANHCEVVGIDGQGFRLLDRVSGDEVRVRARHAINAAGPRADDVRRRLDIDGEDLVRVSRGSHLVLDPREGENALAVFLPDRRIQFVIPHRDGTICGTTDVDEPWQDQEPTVASADVDYLLDALGWLLEPAPGRDDIRFGYCGWRSLPAAKGPPGALNREAFLVRERLADCDLHTVVGGKLTTHRSLAERAIGEILEISEPSPTRELPLPGGEGPREVADPLWWRHGSRAHHIRDLARDRPEWSEPLCPSRPFLAAEAVCALQNEGAVTFADLMLRRLVHTRGPCLDEPCLRRAHDLFLEERRWPVDDDFTAAAAALRAEVRHLAGDCHARPEAAP